MLHCSERFQITYRSFTASVPCRHLSTGLAHLSSFCSYKSCIALWAGLGTRLHSHSLTVHYPCHSLTVQYPCHSFTVQYPCYSLTVHYPCHSLTVQYPCHSLTMHYPNHSLGAEYNLRVVISCNSKSLRSGEQLTGN